MEHLATRLSALALKVWLRLISPSTTRLVAPLLAIGLFWLLHRWYRRMGATALGKAVRWWCLAVAIGTVLAVAMYLLTVLPDDPEALAALNGLDTERLGRTQYPAPLAVLGAVIVFIAGTTATWRRRQARLRPDERAALDASWPGARHTIVRWLALLGGVPLALLVTACAAASMAPSQVPSAPVAGTLWVGTKAGVSRLVAGPPPRWEAYTRPVAPLPAADITGVGATPDGAVWFATRRGLAYFDPAVGTWLEATNASGALPYPEVLALAVDRDGTAWAATGAGGAGVTPDGRSFTFSDKNAPLLHLILDAAYVDPAGRVWFGGAGGVNVYQPPTASAPEGDWPVGFTRYATNGALPDDLVFTITSDRRGRIWFGTLAGAAVLTPDPSAFGLGAYEPARWQTFTPAGSPLANEKVHAIAEDRQGRLWLGTERGVAVYDDTGAGSPRWTQLDAGGSAGLPHPWVQALALGPDGRMWAGTRGGLAVIDPAALDKGWTSYHADPLRRWTGLLWPPHWQQNILSDDVTALTWGP